MHVYEHAMKPTSVVPFEKGMFPSAMMRGSLRIVARSMSGMLNSRREREVIMVEKGLLRGSRSRESFALALSMVRLWKGSLLRRTVLMLVQDNSKVGRMEHTVPCPLPELLYHDPHHNEQELDAKAL